MLTLAICISYAQNDCVTVWLVFYLPINLLMLCITKNMLQNLPLDPVHHMLLLFLVSGTERNELISQKCRVV